MTIEHQISVNSAVGTVKNKSKTHIPTIAVAIFVRLVLILHTILATWRVTLAWGDALFWLMSLGVLLVILEGYITIRVNNGIEWKRVCPCFAIYLSVTLPLIWLLEISQLETYLDSQTMTSVTAKVTSDPGLLTFTSIQPMTSTIASTVTMVTGNLSGAENITMTTTPFSLNTTIVASTVPTSTEKNDIIEIIEDFGNFLQSFSSDTWIVIVEESLVYLIVIGRWLLPRGKVTREELSDLLIDYLAMASDIMELFALFDEEEVRGNRTITYAILSIWSISFIQFVPVVMNRRAANSLRQSTRGNKMSDGCCTCKACGDSFPDIFATLSALFLQDGPFLALRLFIIIYLKILTYSLVFFVLKNIIVVLLLTYRLGVLCFNLPCCYRKDFTIEGVDFVDLEHPVDINPSLDKNHPLKTADSFLGNSQVISSENSNKSKHPYDYNDHVTNTDLSRIGGFSNKEQHGRKVKSKQRRPGSAGSNANSGQPEVIGYSPSTSLQNGRSVSNRSSLNSGKHNNTSSPVHNGHIQRNLSINSNERPKSDSPSVISNGRYESVNHNISGRSDSENSVSTVSKVNNDQPVGISSGRPARTGSLVSNGKYVSTNSLSDSHSGTPKTSTVDTGDQLEKERNADSTEKYKMSEPVFINGRTVVRIGLDDNNRGSDEQLNVRL